MSKKKPATSVKALVHDKTNPLESYVAEWLQEKAEEYSNQYTGVFKDLFYGGCQSGYVSELIYSTDCREFVKKFMVEIQELINERADQANGFEFLFDKDIGFTWDRVAWIAFEETASIIASKNEYDI